MSNYIDSILEQSEQKRLEGKINRKVIVTGLIFWIVATIGISTYFFNQQTINYTWND